MNEEEERLQTIFRAGALPFASLEQPREWKEYSREWKVFQRKWARPALTKAHMKGVVSVE